MRINIPSFRHRSLLPAALARVLGTMVVLLCCITVFTAAEPPPAVAADHQAGTPGKTLRVLIIGNSFSNNATTYLPQIVQSQGKALVLGHASIGGSSMEKHWELAQKNEANPKDPEGNPYYLLKPDGSTAKRLGLKEFLTSQPWDIVTIQQHSWKAPDISTYRPFAKQLADYIHQHAPQAKLWLHETWAYRADDLLMKKTNTTQEKMYLGLHAAYLTIGKELAVERIIPSATAFQNARQDPRWQLEVQKDFDPTTAKYPALPTQVHNLCIGWHWNTKLPSPKLEFDGKHCTTAGKYLGGLVWYETFFGDCHGEVFAPPDLPRQDAAVLAEIAHKTVHDKLLPRELSGAAK